MNKLTVSLGITVIAIILMSLGCPQQEDWKDQKIHITGVYYFESSEDVKFFGEPTSAYRKIYLLAIDLDSSPRFGTLDSMNQEPDWKSHISVDGNKITWGGEGHGHLLII